MTMILIIIVIMVWYGMVWYGMVWYGMFVHVYYTHYFTQLVGRFEANKLEPLSSPEVFGHAVPDAQPIGHPGSSSCTKTSA